MRINSINSSMNVAGIYKTNAQRQKSKINKLKANNSDSIEISDIAKIISNIDDPVINEAKEIERIKTLIENENYEVDSKKLAKAMLKNIR